MDENYGRTDQRTADNAVGISDDIQHPYKRYEATSTWKLLDKAIGDLVENGDLEETTNRLYIVGYLCQTLSSQKAISS